MGEREKGGWGKLVADVRELVSPSEVKTPGALREKVSFHYDMIKEQLQFVGEEFCNQSSKNIEDWTNADLANNFGAIDGYVQEYVRKNNRMYSVVEQQWAQFQLEYKRPGCKVKDVPALLETFMGKLEKAEQHGK